MFPCARDCCDLNAPFPSPSHADNNNKNKLYLSIYQTQYPQTRKTPQTRALRNQSFGHPLPPPQRLLSASTVTTMTTKQRRRSKDGETARNGEKSGFEKGVRFAEMFVGWDGLDGWTGSGEGMDGYVRRFLFYRNPQHTSVVCGGIYFR